MPRPLANHYQNFREAELIRLKSITVQDEWLHQKIWVYHVSKGDYGCEPMGLIMLFTGQGPVRSGRKC